MDLLTRHTWLETYQQCPRKYYFDVSGEKQNPKFQTGALAVGNITHAVLEQFMAQPPAERTYKEAMTQMEAWFDKLPPGEDIYMPRVADCLKTYFQLENPADIHHVDSEITLEANLDLDGLDVVLRGTIDRVAMVLDGVEITDYKTGASKSDSHLTQLARYVLLWETCREQDSVPIFMDFPAVYVQILYLGAPKEKVRVPVSDLDLEKERAHIAKVVKQINKCHEPADFKPKPSMLCGWCGYLDKCEEGQNKVALLADKGAMKDTAPSWLIHDIWAEAADKSDIDLEGMF